MRKFRAARTSGSRIYEYRSRVGAYSLVIRFKELTVETLFVAINPKGLSSRSASAGCQRVPDNLEAAQRQAPGRCPNSHTLVRRVPSAAVAAHPKKSVGLRLWNVGHDVGEVLDQLGRQPRQHVQRCRAVMARIQKHLQPDPPAEVRYS